MTGNILGAAPFFVHDKPPESQFGENPLSLYARKYLMCVRYAT